MECMSLLPYSFANRNAESPTQATCIHVPSVYKGQKLLMYASNVLANVIPCKTVGIIVHLPLISYNLFLHHACVRTFDYFILKDKHVLIIFIPIYLTLQSTKL